MRAKSINEAIKHLPGRSDEEVKAVTNKLVKVDEVTEIMSKERRGTLFCLYTNTSYEQITRNDYSPDPQEILKNYIETTKDFINDYHKWHGDETTLYICIYKITPSLYGTFVHDFNMRCNGSITMLFQNSIDTEDL